MRHTVCASASLTTHLHGPVHHCLSLSKVQWDEPLSQTLLNQGLGPTAGQGTGDCSTHTTRCTHRFVCMWAAS